MHCATFARLAVYWLSSAWSIGASWGPSRQFSDSKSRPDYDKANECRRVLRICTSVGLSQLRYESLGMMAASRSCVTKREFIVIAQPEVTLNSRMNKAPLHRLEIKTMNITWELINHFLKAAEDVHSRADDAAAVTVAGARQIAAHMRRLPLEGPRVEAEQNITNLRKFSVLVYAFQLRLPANCITLTISSFRPPKMYTLLSYATAVCPTMSFGTDQTRRGEKERKIEIVKTKLKVFFAALSGSQLCLLLERAWITQIHFNACSDWTTFTSRHRFGYHLAYHIFGREHSDTSCLSSSAAETSEGCLCWARERP